MTTASYFAARGARGERGLVCTSLVSRLIDGISIARSRPSSRCSPLRVAFPAVREEIHKIVGFWLQLGVSGFRIDAVPFLIGIHGPKPQSCEDPYAYLSELRDFISWRRGDAILLAEANVPLDDVHHYFGGGRRMQLVFDFVTNQHMFLAMADEDATPLRELLERAPHLPDLAQWAIFLRNHDELDLGRLSDAERERVFAKFGPERSMQIYDRGLRRRLAPMLQNDPARLLLAYSLLLTLPGTPVLWYGEEIGMGEDLSLPDRESVRTPMQWSPECNGGFSSAEPERLVRRPVDHGPYAYDRVNATAQRYNPESLLNRLERLIRMRAECAELGWGRWSVVDADAPSVLGLHYSWRNRSTVVLHNFAAAQRDVTFRASQRGSVRLVDLLTGEPAHPRGSRAETYVVSLPAFGFRWLQAVPGETPPSS